MAGEWIAYDLGLPDKPEVQELIDLTGQPVEAIVFRLLRLWGWAAMHTADGQARMTVARLVRTCGADEGFWRAVAAVGWLEIDETDATVAIPGWDRRFSQAAKARLQQADRSASHEDKRKRVGASDGRASGGPTASRGRGEEKREEDPPPPRDAAPKADKQPTDVWQTFRSAWNAKAAAGNRCEWKPALPPDGWNERLADSAWLENATQALARLAKCKYFVTPVPLSQFVGPRFVDLCLGGQYDTKQAPKGTREPDKAPAVAWTGDDAERFEATRRKVLQSLTDRGAD